MRRVRFATNGRVLDGTADGNRIKGADGTFYGEEEIVYLPPTSPTKIFGLVLNYLDHATELGLSAPSEDPVLLMKPPSALIGNYGKIISPKGAKYVHYEAELAVIIGRQARKVRQEDVPDYVSGYTIANDVTVRDYITNTFRPPIRAKGFDTFCPLGPFNVTADEIPDLNNLNLTTRVNGEVRQKGNTRNLIHPVPELVEFITSFCTLEKGDLILTGTPKGISPVVPGDKIEISIDGLGTLTNSVVSEI